MRGETFRAPQAKKIADYYMLIPKKIRLRRAEFRIPTCDYHVPKLKWNVAKFKWNVITAIFIQFSATQSLSLSGFLFKR